MSRWLLVRCAERRCALPVAGVLHVAPAQVASPLPRAPRWVEGIAGYGRAIVPQIALGSLLGGEAGGGLVVVAESGAGEVALRVDAVERVIDLVERPAPHVPAGSIVCDTVRRGRLDIALLDLSGLTIPLAALPVVVTAAPAGARLNVEPQPEESAALDLVCAVADGFIALTLSRVLRVERAGAGTPLCDRDGRPTEDAAAMTVTVALASGSAELGVAQVVGPRRPGTPGYRDARLFDDALLARIVADRSSDGAGAGGGHTRVMYLLGAGERLALLPAAKALRAGAIEHWRPLPGGGSGPDGIVPLGGAILPALDLGRLFGDAPCSRSMAMALDARGSRWAIACDSISERHARIEGRPLTRNGLATLGEARIAEGLVPVLDADRLDLPGTAT